MSMQDSYFQTIISAEEEHALIVGRLEFKIQSLEQCIADMNNLKQLEMQALKDKFKFINLQFLKQSQNHLKLKDEYDLSKKKLAEKEHQIIQMQAEYEGKINVVKNQNRKLLGKFGLTQFDAPNIAKVQTRPVSQIETEQSISGDLQQMNNSCKSSNTETAGNALNKKIQQLQGQISKLNHKVSKWKENCWNLEKINKQLTLKNSQILAEMKQQQVTLIKNLSKIQSESQSNEMSVIIPLSPRMSETKKDSCEKCKKLTGICFDLKKKYQDLKKTKEKWAGEIKKLTQRCQELKKQKEEIQEQYDQMLQEEIKREMEN